MADQPDPPPGPPIGPPAPVEEEQIQVEDVAAAAPAGAAIGGIDVAQMLMAVQAQAEAMAPVDVDQEADNILGGLHDEGNLLQLEGAVAGPEFAIEENVMAHPEDVDDDDFFEDEEDEEEDEESHEESDDDHLGIHGHLWGQNITWTMGPGGQLKQKKKKENRRLLPLVDLGIQSWLKSSSNIGQFEKDLESSVPHTLFSRVLSSAMMAKKFRPLLVMKILKYWPEVDVGIGSLDVESTSAATDYEAMKFDGHCFASQEDQDYRFAKRVMLLIEAFIYSLSHQSNRKLKLLKLHAAPDCDEYYRMLRRTLKRYKSLLKDLESVDPQFGIEAVIDMGGLSDKKFWLDFLKKIRKFIRVIGLTLKSPFMTTDKRDIMKIMSLVDLTRLKTLDIQNERLFNHDTPGNTSDRVDEFIKKMYGPNATGHPWLPKVAECVSLETLSLWYASKVPNSEKIGISFEMIDKEPRVPSPSAIANWKEVLNRLPRLKTLYLGGNCVTGKLESLIGNVPFSLVSLNVEGSRLNAMDYRFLASGKHAKTISEISMGDFDLGNKYDNIMEVLTSLAKIESVDLCMDGYERYRSNQTLNDRQMLNIVDYLATKHERSLKFLSFGGHRISEKALLEIVSKLLPLPNICDFILPVDGLSQTTQDWFTHRVKLPCASGGYPVATLEKDGPEEIKRIITAVRKQMEKCRHRPIWRFSCKSIRDGLRFMF